MHSVLIVIHLFVAIGLVSLILLQRSEGGALGMGGGPGGLMSGRQAGNVLTRATTALALVFFVTSIALTIFTTSQSGGGSVLDRVDPNALVDPVTPATRDLGPPVLDPVLDEAPPSFDIPTASPEDEPSEPQPAPAEPPEN
jgi:preprotein translocase subunit SecG